mmetsp:Transcript_67723/g.107470  ORF Transcript_67723/g.107470 Transcript_67723/m.107470 type:complete len:335 (-) Transcript_67723:39-1043(-)
MKSIIALLLGLVTFCWADTSEEKVSFSSDSADETSSLKGLKVNVYLNAGDDNVPQVAFSTDYDSSRRKYCLNLNRVYEANFTEDCVQDCDYDIVEGSIIELGDASCSVITKDADTATFVVMCPGVGSGLNITFTFAENDGEAGLEYTIELSGYEFISDADDVRFVFEQELVDCTDSRGSGSESEDSDDDTSTDSDDDTNTAEDTDTDDDMDSTTEEPVRRRLGSGSGDSGSGSASEENGVSSDDGEIDVDIAEFKLTNPVASDTCDDGTTTDVEVTSVYQSDDQLIQIIVNRFECDLTLDPFLGIDTSKLLDGAVSLSSIVSFLVMSFVAVFFV